ncbi:MAG: hypothetical protein NZ602_05895 [Thermoguttaceae bacterium]|nr:hypothetical protein [Thermoguttaceae bacterium]MDW8038196.1 hypothetical protein [Thermoguttaceae bacterium]
MFRGLVRYWLRQRLEEAFRQKVGQMAHAEGGPEAYVAQPSRTVPPLKIPSAPLGPFQGLAAFSTGPAGSESPQDRSNAAVPEAQCSPPPTAAMLQPMPMEKSGETAVGADVAVVFALESESGGLEDMLQETGRWRGEGFTVIAGRLEDRQVVIVRTGAGQAPAAHATEALLDGHRPRWVISAGFAGATQPDLDRYDLLVVDSVVRPDGCREVLSPPSQWLALTGFGRIHRGLLLSGDHLVSSPQEKRSLGEKFGASAVDMETFGVVQVCRRRNVPVFAVRIIIDKLDDQLPPEVRGLLKQKTAAARWGAVLGALWHRPSSWKDIYRLKEQALIASDRLARFLAGAITKLP